MQSTLKRLLLLFGFVGIILSGSQGCDETEGSCLDGFESEQSNNSYVGHSLSTDGELSLLLTIDSDPESAAQEMDLLHLELDRGVYELTVTDRSNGDDPLSFSTIIHYSSATELLSEDGLAEQIDFNNGPTVLSVSIENDGQDAFFEIGGVEDDDAVCGKYKFIVRKVSDEIADEEISCEDEFDEEQAESGFALLEFNGTNQSYSFVAIGDPLSDQYLNYNSFAVDFAVGTYRISIDAMDGDSLDYADLYLYETEDDLDTGNYLLTNDSFVEGGGTSLEFDVDEAGVLYFDVLAEEVDFLDCYEFVVVIEAIS